MIKHLSRPTPSAFSLLAVVILSAGCADQSPAPDETWEGAAALSATVRASGFARNDTAMTPIAHTRREQLPIINFPDRIPGGGKVDVRAVHQSVDSAGVTSTFVTLYDKHGGPLKRVYAFRNGKIAFIASPKFKRHAAGWVRSSVRITVFDDTGRPVGQTDHFTEGALGHNHGLRYKARQVADATARLILPAKAHAAEEETACEAEGYLYKAAVWAAATAVATVAIATYKCRNGDASACVGIPTAVSAAAAAAYAAYAAWEKWAACLTNAAKAVPPPPSAMNIPELGSFSGGILTLMPPPPSPGGIDWAINAFIDSAIAAGNVWCSENGDRCIYGSAAE